MPEFLTDREAIVAPKEFPLADFGCQGLFIIPGIAIVKQGVATLIVERQAVGLEVAHLNSASVPTIEAGGLGLELNSSKGGEGGAEADPSLRIQ